MRARHVRLVYEPVRLALLFACVGALVPRAQAQYLTPRALRTMRAAPTTRTMASAICATTRAARRVPPPSRLPAFCFRAEFGSRRAAWRAGTIPKIIPDLTAAVKLKTRTGKHPELTAT